MQLLTLVTLLITSQLASSVPLVERAETHNSGEHLNQKGFNGFYQSGALSLLQLEGFSHHHQLEAFFLLPQSAVSAVSVVLVALVEWVDLEDLAAWVVEASEVLVDSTEIPSALLSLAPHQTDSKPVVGNLAEQVDLAESVDPDY
ncbi:hypothetical protein BY996DRAFT_8395813 [Phakopsora pachyrhizi]|nr:hypothetical protein BY996DRAFT_8395813 [Phakopsora pachyrhizi]